MENPFETIARRLSNIEDLLLDLKHKPAHSTLTPDTEPYGDFHWLRGMCPGVPASTLRVKSASGEIPGLIKFGKRVLYDKVIVSSWIRSQARKHTADANQVNQEASAQISRQLAKRGGLSV